MSSTDYIGHAFGPNSLEVQDMYMRVDKELEAFLDYLDNKFGEKNYLMFLSADHGAPNVPAFMKEHKLPGGNLYAYTELLKELNQLGTQQFGTDGLVKKILEFQVYFDLEMISKKDLDFKKIKEAFISYLDQKEEVVKAFDYDAFDNLVLPQPIKDKLMNGYYFKRSGDIQFILKSQYTDGRPRGTDHGTVYNYDTHIPLIFYGWKIKAGNTFRETYMTDVAPTIAALLKIQAPGGSVGKVLPEVVR
jgi:predicted AlkP superfamily pyrophosphatase or phosphodiesterase